ncbi:hypothetical protein PQX77_020456 [Marasmius sp. AFHP31]|nr:hypothetical protein PQX77_020456 [Marasmius sp. AFHP31]
MLIHHYVRPLLVSAVPSTRSYSLFSRHAHTAELVATVKPRRTPATSASSNGSEATDIFPRLGGLPEVVVTGRANSGKSTLFNAVLGRKGLIETSKKAGRTRTLNFYRIGKPGPGNLVVVDAPGYGQRGRPEWGELFTEYVNKRRHLRQILVTLNLKNGVNTFDKQMIHRLIHNVIDDYASVLSAFTGSSPSSTTTDSPDTSSKRRSHVQIQPIFTKADALPTDRAQAQQVIDEMNREVQETVKEATRDALGGQCDPAVANGISRLICLKPIITSSVLGFGIEEVRTGVLKACKLGWSK